MGTLIRSLYTPDTAAGSPTFSLAQGARLDTATHLSIIALTSTIARLVAGSLSDYLAPTVPVGPPPPGAAQLGYLGVWRRIWGGGKPVVSRMYLLIGFALVMCCAQLFVAFGGVDQKGERFWIVSSAMGSGYGAVFTLSVSICFLLVLVQTRSKLTFLAAYCSKCRLGRQKLWNKLGNHNRYPCNRCYSLWNNFCSKLRQCRQGSTTYCWNARCILSRSCGSSGEQFTSATHCLLRKGMLRCSIHDYGRQCRVGLCLLGVGLERKGGVDKEGYCCIESV